MCRESKAFFVPFYKKQEKIFRYMELQKVPQKKHEAKSVLFSKNARICVSLQQDRQESYLAFLFQK